ncbi:MAG: nuclear transport factor 2 family protein, partial [Halobacteria archaeon]|nr:nuclear transport factor 2 family protein [Halobacteria archaeon]
LHPYFAEDDDVVKFGVSERLVGYDEVEEGLRRQTRRTEDWNVESRDLRVTERGFYAWFSDSVRMEWNDTRQGERYEMDTRWSGTLERRESRGEGETKEWVFVGMHVSVPAEL